MKKIADFYLRTLLINSKLNPAQPNTGKLSKTISMKAIFTTLILICLSSPVFSQIPGQQGLRIVFRGTEYCNSKVVVPPNTSLTFTATARKVCGPNFEYSWGRDVTGSNPTVTTKFPVGQHWIEVGLKSSNANTACSWADRCLLQVEAYLKPVSSFRINGSNNSSIPILKNATVQFADKSTNTPRAWQYKIKKGTAAVTTLTSKISSYRFTKSGTYTVSFSCSNPAGVSSVITRTIIVR